MNILPHKSWHVYNKKNIEKVRKDEAKAAIEEKEKQKRVLLAENEFRLDILRKRAEQRSANEDVKDSGSTLSNEVSICVKSEPLNLFTQEELFGGKNKEYELEKKKKEIALEKQYTMYLDKDTSEESMPWYVKKSHKEKYKDQYKWKNNKHGDKARKRGIIELKDDPLQFINGIMEKSRQNEEYIPKKHKSSKRKSREESSVSVQPLVYNTL
ncbi:hypothetical protein BDB01DRAFT_800433 [Pilobolus umbonatus]|nr:hypothetical protein BDB01DRAFT_800433 [Pilobolus umbonatus]